ncbi:MAG: ExbD/TolR family protein [Saprospiraceae bacterium]|jgi:biopolymer transport protein ExbD
MKIQRRNKVNANFSMSSLTDIIFLLLIFFMLTSSLVAPNALNLKLPGSAQSKTQIQGKIDRITVADGGNLFLNGKNISAERLEAVLAARVKETGQKLNIGIKPLEGVAVEHVVAVMDIAMRLNINAILDVPQ